MTPFVNKIKKSLICNSKGRNFQRFVRRESLWVTSHKLCSNFCLFLVPTSSRWLSLSLMFSIAVARLMKRRRPRRQTDGSNTEKFELWISVKRSGAWQLCDGAPVVLRQIKTFRGANELFSAAFVSSPNQSPQVAVSVTTYAAAALSLQKA